MLSAGLESLLDSPVAAVLEELYPGLPGSVSTELMAVPGPALGLGAQREGSVPVLTRRDSPWAPAVGRFCQKPRDPGDALEVVSRGPAESLPEELLQLGDRERGERNKKRRFRKVGCSSDGYQKEEEEAQGAEDHHAEGSTFTPGEAWSKQEDLHCNQQEAKSSGACCTEIAGSLRSTEENQANVQVTAATLPKLPEEVQGMKADGTRIFSKAGYRSDRVSKGLPAESKECPDVDTVLARAGVTQTNILDFLEPFRVTDFGAATHHPQETNDSTVLEAHTATRAGGSGVSALEIEEEKLPRRNPVHEFSASIAPCQTRQQDEEHDAHDICKGAVPGQNDPCGLSSAGSCRTLSTLSSGVLCPVLKSISHLGFRNMPVENSSTAIHGIVNEPPLKYLPQNMERHTHYSHRTGFVGNPSSTSVPVEQIPALRNKGLSSAKTDPRELSAGIGKSYSSQFGEAAELWRKIALGDNMEVGSQPETQQGVEHCHSSVFSSVASFPVEFSKEKFKRVPSEGEKLKKDQWQFSLSNLCKDGIKENSLLMETGNIASHRTGQRDISSYNTSNKIPPPRHHSCLDLSSKLEEDPPKAQLLVKDSESSKTSDGLAGGVDEAAEADGSDSLSTGKETHLFYTLNVNLPPVLQKLREPHHNECPPCTANEILHRDKAWDHLSGKETMGASGTTREQGTAVLFHKDKLKSSVSSRTFGNSDMAHRVSQKDMKPAGSLKRVVTGLENEHCCTQHCNNQGMKKQCTAASASCVLSGSARGGEVFLNSHSIDVDKKIEENGNSEGESSAGYSGQEAVIFPEAHFPLPCGSLPREDDWGSRDVALRGMNDIPSGKPMFCSAYTAEKSAATLVGDEISNKNTEVKVFDVGEVAHGSRVLCDREQAEEQRGLCASQREQCGGTTVASPNAPEGNQRNKTSEELSVRYLAKTARVQNFGFCSSLGTREQEEVASLPAGPSDCSTSACAACPAPANVSVPTHRASPREPTLCPREQRCQGCQRELGGPGPGSEPCLETLPDQPNPGLQTADGSEEESESGSSVGEEIVLTAGDDLPLLMHRYAREDRFEGTLRENVVNLNSLAGVRNKDCSGYMDSINDPTEEKTIKVKEHEDDCETGRKGTPQESSSESKARGSQHCFTKPAQEKAELVFAGNRTHPSLPKMKSLVEDQGNTVGAQFLPISSIHGSLSYNPENMNVLSDTEHRESLSIKPVLSSTCPQVMSEPGKETSAPSGVGPSHSVKFDIQEPFSKTQVDSETLSALSCGISLPEEEKLSPENKQRDNCEPSSAKVFSKDSSMTKILSVTISVKRKCSNIEIPSSGTEMAAGSLNGAKSSRVCAHSKGSLKGEGHCTAADMDGTSPKSPPCEEKFKNTSKPENMNVLSDTEHRESLSIKPVLSSTCPQVMSESGKETSASSGVGPSHSGKFDIQEPFSKTQVDSETLSALSCGISLPEEEKLSPDNKQRDDNLFSDKKFSKDSSMTKILSVIISVKRKCSNIEIPSSGTEMAAGSLNGAKSSRVCAHSKESLKGEGHCTAADMDGTSPKSPPCEEKFKNTCVEEKMEKEMGPRKKLLRSHPWALLEDFKESGGKIVALSTENRGKVLEEIPRSNPNYVSYERGSDGKLTNVAGSSVLSAAVQHCQAVSEAEASPELQCDPAPTLHPPLSSPPHRGTGTCPDWVAGREARVPYRSAAQSTEHKKEGTEGQDTGPGHALCKENEASGSKRLDQIERHQVTKQRKYEKMEVYQPDQAHQEQNLERQEKAEITPSTLHSSELLDSSSNELVTSRNQKFEGPLEETFAVRSSESKLCSTLQEVKRPKIITDIISSQFLKTQDSEMENLNLNLGYDGIPGAFGSTSKLRGTTDKLGGPLPLRIQPGRTCKKVPTLHQLKTIRKLKKIKSPPFFELPLQIFPKQENTPLESLYFPCKPLTVESALRFAPVPRQRARRGSLLNSLKFRKCTKEPALLSKLSAMASKLLGPAKGAWDLEPRPYSSEMLPVGDRHSHQRSKNLLEAFSCINRSVHSRWAGSWCTKMFSFQPLALYPVETTKIPFSDLSHKPPTPLSDTPVFPISFHIKLDSSPVPDLAGVPPQPSVQHGPASGGTPAPPSKWTLSFLLSQSCSDTTAFKEDSTPNTEFHSSGSVTTPRTVALHPDRGRNTVAERRGGCSRLGLHTVLALSSPGCYRIWTRRRNLSSHIPTIQRLFISQLAQGLKGARYPSCVSADLDSSWPYSLGRVLSIWSQHGPSARPSEIPPLHSNHCKWQPSVGIENSYAMLPHLPAQSMEALQAAGCDTRLEASLPFPKPPTPAESLPSPPRLQVRALEEADAPVPACLRPQDDTELKKTEPEKRPKKVSEIRIRKTVPKPDTNLTPMGLPKPKRLKKKEFSLEEIYTNKNYKSPPPARSLETIFEEPKEKNGHLISVSQQKRKRILEFQDFTLPRKRKTRGKVKAVGSFTRAKRAALQSAELDVLLSEKLTALEAFFAEEVEQEQDSSV